MVGAWHLWAGPVYGGGIATVAATNPCASASGMVGAGIGTSGMPSLPIFVFLGREPRNMSGTVPGPRNASFFPFRSSRTLIGEFGITMIRSNECLGVL